MHLVTVTWSAAQALNLSISNNYIMASLQGYLMTYKILERSRSFVGHP